MTGEEFAELLERIGPLPPPPVKSPPLEGRLCRVRLRKGEWLPYFDMVELDDPVPTRWRNGAVEEEPSMVIAVEPWLWAAHEQFSVLQRLWQDRLRQIWRGELDVAGFLE